MSSTLPPAATPAETTPSPEQTGSSPGNDDIAPSPTPVVPIQVPLPSLPPQQIGSISPSPLVALPPILPAVVTSPPTVSPILSPPPPPTLPPVSSQLPPSPPQPLPQLQPQPVPPVIPPTPVTKDNPPPDTIAPPNISPPADKPVTVTHSPPIVTIKQNPSTPPTSPAPSVRQPKTRPVTTKPSPLRPKPSSPPLPASQLPSVTKPVPSLRPSTSKIIPSSKPTQRHSPLAASAVLPTQPPVALPVPQTPAGGAWFPSTTAPPSILPSIPKTPAVLNSPFSGGSDNNGVSSSSSFLGPSGASHQNIEASVPSSRGSSGFVVGLVIGGFLLLVLGVIFGILVCFCRRRQKKFEGDGSGKIDTSIFRGFEDKASLPKYTKQGANIPGNQIPVNATTPLTHSTVTSSGTFAYDELAVATSGFSDKNLLGQGGFGYVYKGVLPNGKEVAVKQLKMGGHQGEREFHSEVDTISQVHHKHLVSLVGYCISGIERLLVYEFVSNNTLDFHLHGKEQPVMDWPTRLKIAIGSAKGLAYLHEDCSPSIIHRDIKAANILLDFNFEAKVSDFGLAKICSSTNPSVTHMTTRVVGTFGYLAPEYASSGKVTDKSDVYSYGVVLLELITGCPAISNFGPATNGSLVNWARPLLAQAIADGNFDTLSDSRLQSNYNVSEMAIMVSCAAACVRLSSWRRPRMSQVIRALEGNLSASELDGGTKAGHSSMHYPYANLDFDARNYIDDMKRMALDSCGYSDNTSDFGVNPSASSSDTNHHIR